MKSCRYLAKDFDFRSYSAILYIPEKTIKKHPQTLFQRTKLIIKKGISFFI